MINRGALSPQPCVEPRRLKWRDGAGIAEPDPSVGLFYEEDERSATHFAMHGKRLSRVEPGGAATQRGGAMAHADSAVFRTEVRRVLPPLAPHNGQRDQSKRHASERQEDGANAARAGPRARIKGANELHEGDCNDYREHEQPHVQAATVPTLERELMAGIEGLISHAPTVTPWALLL